MINTAAVAPPKARFDSLSVLPFVTGSLDPALEYLVHGLSEGIAALARAQALPLTERHGLPGWIEADG